MVAHKGHGIVQLSVRQATCPGVGTPGAVTLPLPSPVCIDAAQFFNGRPACPLGILRCLQNVERVGFVVVHGSFRPGVALSIRHAVCVRVSLGRHALVGCGR